MILLTRSTEPDVLQTNTAAWTAKLLAQRQANPTRRPPSSQYAHANVMEALEAMSDGKCFYCECKLDATEREVDHYVEVSEASERAFDWGNLYLSCKGCNAKIPNAVLPCSSCIDPCSPDRDPREHLAFEDEIVRPRNDSTIGRATIRKYKLDRGDLELRRSRRLRLFSKELDAIKDRLIQDGRKQMSPEESERLLKYRQREQPFSQMFLQLPIP